jgi:hypothetical protein
MKVWQVNYASASGNVYLTDVVERELQLGPYGGGILPVLNGSFVGVVPTAEGALYDSFVAGNAPGYSTKKARERSILENAGAEQSVA